MLSNDEIDRIIDGMAEAAESDRGRVISWARFYLYIVQHYYFER